MVVLLLVSVVGCSQPAGKSKHWTAVHGTFHPTELSSLELSTPTKPFSATTSLPAAPPLTNDSARPGPIPSSDDIVDPPFSNWVALDAWSQSNHLGTPRPLLSATGFTLELHTTNGVIALTAGSNLARFNGLTCCLGYAPRYRNGQFVVHVLDAEKNVRPLAGLDAPCLPVNSTVVIDAGHGGENAGTRCVLDSHFEKEFTLDWALRLRTVLASNGWNVVLTRTNDVDVSLADRVARAERLNASVFVSLHFNSAFPRQDQSGIETFCLTPAGLPSTLARDSEDDASRVFPNNAYDDQNLQYAVRLHRALVETQSRDFPANFSAAAQTIPCCRIKNSLLRRSVS
jgi:N-acetylmuramoyl-L-alanine amidase